MSAVLHRSRQEAPYLVRRVLFHGRGDVAVGVQREARAVVTQQTGECFHVHTVLYRQGGEGMPLRYNNDKSRQLCI